MDEQDLPPGFHIAPSVGTGYLLAMHGWHVGTFIYTRDARAAAWSIYQAVELDVLRELAAKARHEVDEWVADYTGALLDAFERRVAELEGGVDA